MKIYIYGNQSFKKEIHQTLEHSNIKFKIDSNLEIEDINNLSKLKQKIIENPNDIYLIDDEKILRKNSLNNKIKFLAPKDGIEEEFLLESGVSDLSIDSIKELPKYIIKKCQELKIDESEIFEEKKSELQNNNSIENLDDELSKLLVKEDEKDFDTQKDINLDNITNDFSDDIINKSDETDNFHEEIDFNDNFGLNNISFDYDDDDIMFREENITIDEKKSNDFDEFDFLDQIVDDDESLPKFDHLDLENEFDFLSEQIEELKSESKQEVTNIVKVNEQIKESLQGDKMTDEFFELDSISEKDLLDALNYRVDEKNIENDSRTLPSLEKQETVTINSSNVNDLSQLISKLLTNKTLEITIKIKD